MELAISLSNLTFDMPNSYGSSLQHLGICLANKNVVATSGWSSPFPNVPQRGWHVQSLIVLFDTSQVPQSAQFPLLHVVPIFGTLRSKNLTPLPEVFSFAARLIAVSEASSCCSSLNSSAVMHKSPSMFCSFVSSLTPCFPLIFPTN